MATKLEDPTTAASTEGLQALARRHLWMHFSRMGTYSDAPGAEIPIIARGDGCYVYDEHGKRYFDGLSALFCVNAGHGRPEASRRRPPSRSASWTSTRRGAMRTRARSSSPRGSPS